jgi:hypothetical protein
VARTVLRGPRCSNAPGLPGEKDAETRTLRITEVIPYRYDKAPESYEASLHLRGLIMWLKFLTSTT